MHSAGVSYFVITSVRAADSLSPVVPEAAVDVMVMVEVPTGVEIVVELDPFQHTPT